MLPSWRRSHDRHRDAAYRVERDHREQAPLGPDDPRHDDRGCLGDRFDRRRQRLLQGRPVNDPEPRHQRAGRAGKRRLSLRRAGEHRRHRLAEEGRRRSARESQSGPGCQERLARRRRQRRIARLQRHQLRTVLVRRHDPLLPDGPLLQDRRRILVHLRRRHKAPARRGDRPGSGAGTVRRGRAPSGRT